MPSSEFRQWAVAEKLEPFGEYGHWLRHGLQMALIAGMMRKDGAKGPSPEDFIPETMRSNFDNAIVEKKGIDSSGRQDPKHIFAVMMMVKAHQDAVIARQRKEEEKRQNARNRRASRIPREAKQT